MKRPNNNEYLCKNCGGVVTKKTKHTVKTLAGIKYECPFDVDHYEEAGRFAREGLHPVKAERIEEAA